jgi:hypothetical protein
VTRSGLAVAVLYGLTLLAVFTLALSSLTEFDFWWYLASGERILATRSVPATDPFSYTAQGRPWINHMWASQVLVLELWQAGGRIALVVLKGLIVTATFGVVLLTMRRRGVHPILASLVTLVAAWAGWEFWDVRPQIVTYLLLAVFLYLLREGWETRPRTLAWLPLLMVPWANLHAGFVTGIAIIGLVGVGTALPSLAGRERRRAGWRVLGLATGVGVVTGLASLVNPYGLQAVLFPLEVVNTRVFMSSTAEWFSPNFHNPVYRGFELMLLLLVPAFAWGRGRLGVTDALVGLTFAHLGLSSARHVPLFAVAVAPLLADGLQSAVQEAWSGWPRAWDLAGRLRRALPSFWPIVTSARTPVAVVAFGLLVGVGAGWIGFLDPIANPFLQDLNERRYPRDTIAFIKGERLPAPLFNAYAWGGYELWRLYPEYRVFMDGRTHVYGREVLQDFLEVSTLGRRWRAVLDKWGIQTVLAQRPSQLAQVLLAVGGWRLVFVEREAAVFVRESEGNQALLERLPPVSLWPPIPEVVTALVAGLSAVEAGDDERAVRHYREALAVVPDHPVALMSLGILQEKRGRTAEARALFERIVELYGEGELVDKARGRLRGLP